MSSSAIESWQDLYFALIAYDPRQHHHRNLHEGLILPARDAAIELAQSFLPFQQLSDIPTDEDRRRELLWDLYAISRISDHLLLPFQATSPSDWRDNPALTIDQFLAFFVDLGFDPFDPRRDFSPFHHEVVRVTQSPDPDEPITVIDTLWPGLFFGEMLFVRAGVHVRGGASFILKPIAEASTLYFAHRRLHRPVSDRSQGWGHNSQWRTDFHLFYEHQGELHYNVGRRGSPMFPEETLNPAERLELLRNRCFLTCPKPHDDLWPFDDTHVEPLQFPQA